MNEVTMNILVQIFSWTYLAYPIVILICISLMTNDIVLVNYDSLINNLKIASGVQQ